MVSFDQKINFILFLLNVPHTMPDWFAKYQETRIFFPVKNKNCFLKRKKKKKLCFS